MSKTNISSHSDPEQATVKQHAALRAEIDTCLAKQGAVSKKQAALREIAAAEEQQKVAVKSLEHQAEVKTEIRAMKARLCCRSSC